MKPFGGRSGNASISKLRVVYLRGEYNFEIPFCIVSEIINKGVLGTPRQFVNCVRLSLLLSFPFSNWKSPGNWVSKSNHFNKDNFHSWVTSDNINSFSGCFGFDNIQKLSCIYNCLSVSVSLSFSLRACPWLSLICLNFADETFKESFLSLSLPFCRARTPAATAAGWPIRFDTFHDSFSRSCPTPDTSDKIIRNHWADDI